MRYLKLIKDDWVRMLHRSRDGIALFIVLSSLATLTLFIGEITYTSQVNQKLAYDRLDQIKAHALAKSGLRIALLRIRAYVELKKTINQLAGSAGVGVAAANSVVPKSILEKIWSEPLIIPFTGDVSALPLGVRDALLKFRKDSGMEGKLYIKIESQSSKFNLNSLLPSVAYVPTPTPTPTPGRGSGGNNDASATPTPIPYSAESSREQLLKQIETTLQSKFEHDEDFRERYRNLNPKDLMEEIIGWANIKFQTQREERSPIPFKLAPYYDISELNYLPTMDDELYKIFSGQFTATQSSGINVNTINDATLKAIIPGITEDELKAFFEYRDIPPPEDHTFKTPDDFFKYLSEHIQVFKANASKVQDLKDSFTQRGIQVLVDEQFFKVRIEATLQQTKRTLEALVSVIPPPSTNSRGRGTNTPNSGFNDPFSDSTHDPSNNTNNNGSPAPAQSPSNLKITQLRFL